jgi:hypothetical protein
MKFIFIAHFKVFFSCSYYTIIVKFKKNAAFCTHFLHISSLFHLFLKFFYGKFDYYIQLLRLFCDIQDCFTFFHSHIYFSEHKSLFKSSHLYSKKNFFIPFLCTIFSIAKEFALESNRHASILRHK